jgi:transcriptional regulator with XRE-family HTH domain
MPQIYFEAKGEEILEKTGMKKAEFARRMGIRKQNVKALFKSNNINTIYKAASVMGVPFEILIGYVEEPDIYSLPIVPHDPDYEEPKGVDEALFTEDDIPTGESVEDKRRRHKIILAFYHDWKKKNPEARKYNIYLKDYINIRYISIEETAGQASLTYLSTLAVLQLDAILTNAVLVEKLPANQKKNNQKGFESLLRMSYNCIGIGTVKMYVGVKRSDKSKVQYCITAIEAKKTKQEA